MTDLPALPGDTTPETIYAQPAEWVASGAGAQGNLFLTGRAGTGKTTLLRKFMAQAGESAIVLAPTGVAAMNAGGQTLHSFFKFPPRLIEPQDVKRLRTARLMKAAETIIIDEISMVRVDMLDAIDRSLKLNRGSKRPFGGVRMILSGDLHQLPPVVRGDEDPILRERYGGHYFFNAPAFKEAEFATTRQPAFSKACKLFVYGESAPHGSINLDVEVPSEAELQSLTTSLKSVSVSANDIFTIGWTSGTTGEPKGVPRSHNMWQASALISYEAAQFDQTDVLLNPHQLVNPASIAAFFFNWLMCQGTLVLHHPLDLQVYLKQIELEKVTYTVAPPAVLTKLLNDPALMSDINLSSVRFIGSGGAALSRWMVKEFQDKLNIPIINMYGSNEGAALISSFEDVSDPGARAENFPRFGASGLVWSNRSSQQMKTRLIDLESGEEITEPGKAGELMIWGASVFDGYYNSPETNKTVFSKDGFFHTGDLFEISGNKDHSSFYRFVGRCKDIIVRGGMKITPNELDNLLAGHPKIAEVAVVGYADDVLEERVCAVAVVKPGQVIRLEELIAYLKEKNVAVFKLPEKLVIVGELPRNPSGKVLRYKLRELVERQ